MTLQEILPFETPSAVSAVVNCFIVYTVSARFEAVGSRFAV